MPSYRITFALLALVALLFSIAPNQHALAQDNLLENGGFNGAGSYRDHRAADSEYSFAFAPGWGGWQTHSPRTQPWMNLDAIAFPHSGEFKREGDASQNIGRGSATFTAAAHQIVNNIPEGTTLRFSVWVFQENDAGSNARTRVGIGSNSGGNPLAGQVTWSNWLQAVNSWQQVSVEATVPEGSVTVFIYSTQGQPNDPNHVYYDDAKLVVVGEGEVDVGDDPDAPPPPTATPRPVFAPFVSPQQADESGRIEHVVQSGDTLAAISVAYGVPLREILELNDLDRSTPLRIGQTILIQEAGEAPAAEETTEVESTTEVEVTAEATAEIVAATATPRQPSATPTESEPTETPSPTPVPPTPTEAPPAPVEEGADSDPLSVEAAICVTMFDDANQNGLYDSSDEALLAGGEITLRPQDSTDEELYITDGESEPHCFADLATGSYVVNGLAPAGFGLRRSSLLVNVPPGQQFQVRFAAIEGLEVAAAPTASATATPTGRDPDLIEEQPNSLRNLRNIAGLVVLGMAGLILVGGIGVAVIAGRR